MTVVDTEALRRALGSFMTGVTVVTTRSEAGEPIGFTANSFTSVSLDPPLLLVCPGRHLTSYERFGQIEYFAVSVLAEGQERVSNVFASAGDDRFAQAQWQPDLQGSPLIDGACAWFSCRVHQRHAAGDHLILVGEIVDFRNAKGHGLGYCSNGYFSLSREQQSDVASRRGRRGRAGVLVDHEGRLLLDRSATGLRLPTFELPDDAGPRTSLEHRFEALGLDIALGPVYSVYDDESGGSRTTFFRARSRSDRAGGLGHYEPIDTLRPNDFTEPAEASMVARFVSEYANRDFGFYLGNHQTGEVHRVSDERD